MRKLAILFYLRDLDLRLTYNSIDKTVKDTLELGVIDRKSVE